MNDDRVRIFVSSPADVDHERAMVKDVIEGLAQEYLPYFPLQAVLWEEEALTADRTFQAGLTRPADCEIVLVILWTRLGSPLPQEPYRGMTGTEWEFVNAVEGSGSAGNPEVLVYKKTAPRLVDITDAEAARQAVDDRRRLDEFFRRHFFNEDNTFRRAFRTFDSDAGFRDLLEVQLRKLLNRRISVERRASTGDRQWRGSPFRVGRPFDTGDERVFTGREREVRELLTRLSERAAAGRGLLLITGASGSGKTSLLRAGLVPRLTRPFQFEEVATVRCCLVHPRTDGATPIDALAARLCAPDCLGDALGRFGLAADRLARLLSNEPAVAAHQIATAATVQARAGHPEAIARLAVIVDPLDALFTHGDAAAEGDIDDAALRAFAAALHALAVGEGVWVIASLRSDALRHLPRLGPLLDLLDAPGWAALEPPATARIRQVMEIPARIAGIDLDTRDDAQGRGLVELVEAEAATLRLWPPPVQGVLERAYRAALASGTVTDAGEVQVSARHYREQGGLAGHVVAHALELWDGLDEAARAALPRLCRALITLDTGATARPAIRAGDLRVLERDGDARRLLNALIDARLVVAEGVRDGSLLAHCEPPDFSVLGMVRGLWRQSRDEWQARWLRRREGTAKVVLAAELAVSATPDEAAIAWNEYHPMASFAHPALISDWPPVRDWVRRPENRDLLRLRTQLTRQAQLWKRTNCNREYLFHETGFAAARELGADYADEIEPLEREFLAQSAANLGFLRRRNRIVRGFGVLLVGLLVAATIAAGVAFRASNAARVNLNRSLLKEADLHIARGNTPQAVIQAIDAGPDLPDKAVQVLSLAFSGNRLVAMAQSPGPSPGDPRIPAFNADGTRLATLVSGEGPRLWRLENGRFVPDRDLDANGLALHSLVIGGAREQVFGIGDGGIWRLPADASEPPLYACGTRSGSLFTMDAGRRYLAIARNLADGRHGVCVIDLATPGRVLFDLLLPEAEIRGLDFSPDGQMLLAASAEGRAHLIDLSAARVVLALPREGPLGRPFNNAVFDAAGERIAIAAVDERVRVYRRDGTPIAELAESVIGGRRFKIHKSAVRDVAFAPDGQFLVAVDDEGQVVRWSLDGSAQAMVLGNHGLSADEVAIVRAPAKGANPGVDPDNAGETLVLTASLDMTARLWGLQTGKPIAVLGHDGAVSSAHFSASGSRVFTFSERDGSVRLWSIDPVSRLAYQLPHPDHVWGLDMAAAPRELAPGGKALLLATAGFDGGVRVWRYARGLDGSVPRPLGELQGHGDKQVRQVLFSPSGRLLASAGYDGIALVQNLVSGRVCRLRVASADAPVQVYNVLFGPDEHWVLTTSDDPRQPVRLFSLDACAAIDAGPALEHGGAPVAAAALAPAAGGALVVTGDDAGVLRVLSSSADGVWERRCELPIEDGPIGDVALAPDAQTIGVTGSSGRAALVAIGEAGCRVETDLRGHNGRVYSIAFSPDGRLVLTGSLDKTARVWERDGTPRAVLLGHEDRIYRASFSPGDGRWLLTASRDGTIRLWPRPGDDGTGVQELTAFLPLQADLGGVASAAFSPDGHYIAGAYWENAALLWRLWVEDDEVPPALVSRWGRDRARLALIEDAYRFRRDNRVVDREAAEQAASQ